MDHNQSLWRPPPADLALQDQVHVWLYDLSTQDPGEALLAPAERARAQRLRRPGARAQYIAAYALLRVHLGQYLHADPQALELQRRPQGKPVLSKRHGTDLHFNLSHSGNWLLLAFARGREVGVDIEVHRPADAVALAKRFFCPGEAARIEAQSPGAQRQAQFFALWTAKEALAKAIGTGIAGTLNRFELSVEGARVRWHDLRGECPPEAWSVQGLPAPAGASAALATAGDAPAVQCYQAR